MNAEVWCGVTSLAAAAAAFSTSCPSIRLKRISVNVRLRALESALKSKWRPLIGRDGGRTEIIILSEWTAWQAYSSRGGGGGAPAAGASPYRRTNQPVTSHLLHQSSTFTHSHTFIPFIGSFCTGGVNASALRPRFKIEPLLM